MTHRLSAAPVALGLALLLPTASPAQERVDFNAVFAIKDEGLQRSKVMETLSYLTDVHGPRLSGSPSYDRAAEWAQAKFAEWGLVNIHRDPFEFGRGCSNERFARTSSNRSLIPSSRTQRPGHPAPRA